MSGRDQPLRPFLDELARRTGLRLSESHEDRLGRALAQRQIPATTGRIRTGHLVEDAELLDALLDAVSIDESYFFRHPEQLEFVRSDVLPRLLEDRDPHHTLQLWSAGCADGEEPYSLAIILAEEGLLGRAAVLATDLTAAALERARQACYSRWALRAPEVQERQDLFRVAGTRFQLDPEVVGSVTFRQHNLLDPVYPSPPAGEGFDVILCRNVLLHLDRDAVDVVVPRLTAALAPGGWLITAPADPVPTDAPGTRDLEAVVVRGGGVLYRRRTDAGSTHEPELDTPTEIRARLRPSPRRHARPEASRRPAVPVADRDHGVATNEDGRSRCAQAQALLAADQPAEAVVEALAAVFLSPDLPATHLTLGLAAARAEQHGVAARAFRRAAVLLDRLPATAVVELTEGELAGPLAELARAHALLATERNP